MIRFLEISNHVLFWYYLASNFAYLVMLVVALKTTAPLKVKPEYDLATGLLEYFRDIRGGALPAESTSGQNVVPLNVSAE